MEGEKKLEEADEELLSEKALEDDFGLDEDLDRLPIWQAIFFRV